MNEDKTGIAEGERFTDFRTYKGSRYSITAKGTIFLQHVDGGWYPVIQTPAGTTLHPAWWQRLWRWFRR